MPDLLTPITDLLAAVPLLTVFLVIGLGTAVGHIPFGPIRFGAAGALFVGLAVGALDPRLGQDLGLLRSLGLALFCYTVGLAAGNTFFRDLTRQLPLMSLAVGALVLAGGAGALYSQLVGVSPAMDAGAYAGALTSPVLDAAIEAAGTQEPAVGYALAYPVGVAVAILVVALIIQRDWPAARDPRPASADGITATSVHLLRRVRLDEMEAFQRARIRISYLERDGDTRVAAPGEELLPGDKVVVVGSPTAVEEAVHELGSGLNRCLAKDHSVVDHRRLTVSSTRVAGRTIGELDMPGRFQGVITRVKRGDLDLLAHDDLVLELGDRVLAVVPSDELERAADYFGDSERSIAQIDAFSVGLGMALGVLVGLVALPLPGGLTLRLGVAAGPLVVGMVLGRLGRSGPFLWGLPHAANATIRQLGLLFFLAAIGLASGPDFAAAAFSLTGLAVGGLAALIVLVNAAVLLTGARLAGVSAVRAAGGFAGLVGQPAILVFALSKRDDERVEAGYATLFALAIVVKIVMVQVLVAL
ncbi:MULTISPECIES: aspartate:alanine exchanger family transporter [Actinomyces]|uniref:Transporter n=1 Tax=Actinomyces respiraculi TaxID=2744574 RepID=A0A7T0LKU3_9ACTO|nr:MULTISPECIES: TrkA C-terminal domain-containing protein [Actinomyces]QPL05457.1 transporter [Actinomyces respiraculi]